MQMPLLATEAPNFGTFLPHSVGFRQRVQSYQDSLQRTTLTTVARCRDRLKAGDAGERNIPLAGASTIQQNKEFHGSSIAQTGIR